MKARRELLGCALPVMAIVGELFLLLSFLLWAFPSVAGCLGFSMEDAVWTLLVPIIIELPQVVGRSFFLLFLQVFSRKALKWRDEGAYPKVSVIVPAHNEEEYIQDTVRGLLEDDYPNKEIIVVDDGSTDKTFVKAAAFADGSRVKVVRRERASGAKAKAVNYGLLFASGDVIVILDGDTVVGRSSIKELVKPMLQDPEVIGVAGNVKVLNRKNLLTKLQSYEYFISMEMGRRLQGALGGILVIPGAFGAIRREAMESLGRMHADTITEDFDMTVMLQKVRKKVVFSAEAVAYTHVPERWKEWVRQRRRWSAGQAQVYLKHSNLFFRRRFGLFGSIIAPNNVFMDMVLLLARYAWLIAVFLPSLTSLDRVFRLLLLILTFYFMLELCQLSSSAFLASEKEELKQAFLAPLMMMFYRPIHSLVRMSAYLNALFGRRISW